MTTLTYLAPEDVNEVVIVWEDGEKSVVKRFAVGGTGPDCGKVAGESHRPVGDEYPAVKKERRRL